MDLPSVFEFDGDVTTALPPPPLPEGEYRATVIEAVPAVSKSGNNMIVITMLVPASEYPVDYTDGNPDGTKVIDRRVMPSSVADLYRVREACEAYGVKPRRSADGRSSIDVNDFRGQDVRVTIGHREYQGRMQVEAKNVQPA